MAESMAESMTERIFDILRKRIEAQFVPKRQAYLGKRKEKGSRKMAKRRKDLAEEEAFEKSLLS